MKSFPYSGRSFNGIFNYLKRVDRKSVNITTDGNVSHGDLTDMVFNPYESTMMIDVDEKIQPQPYFIIDFSSYKAYIINYQIQTMKQTTPPCAWNISGSNDNKTWYLLDEKSDQDEKICEKQTAENIYKCKSRETTSYTIDNQIGPFRYIKYVCIRNRANLYDIRIGGFELYGSIIPLNGALIARQSKCIRYTQNHIFLFICTMLYCV